MKEQLFRKKSLEKISSPEQLNDYIKVANPGIWMMITATAMLVAGVCIWGVFGKMDTSLTAVGTIENKTLTCYIKSDDISSVKAGDKLKINDNEYRISSISQDPVEVTNDMEAYAKHVGNLQNGEWVYEAKAKVDNEQNGVYKTNIIVKDESPLSFILK